MKLFGFFAAFAAAQDFSVLTAAAEDLDKIVSSTTGNVKEVGFYNLQYTKKNQAYSKNR